MWKVFSQSDEYGFVQAGNSVFRLPITDATLKIKVHCLFFCLALFVKPILRLMIVLS